MASKVRFDEKLVSPISLSALERFLRSCTIEEAYEFFGFDYRMEREFEEAERQSLEAGKPPSYLGERRRFLAKFNWICEPSSDFVRRFFNQVNSLFAEKLALTNTTASPYDFLLVCNRLLLYRQVKNPGFRSGEIEFGTRKDLDFMDPRRHFQLARGIAARLIPEAIKQWSECVTKCPRSDEMCLLLTMALIAIHPFRDGNGRVARLTFTWLKRRFGHDDLWLAEADDGEFLRVGVGVQSTEYFMGRFTLALCNGHNHVRIDGHPPSRGDEERAGAALAVALESCGVDLVHDERFLQLRQHFEATGHFRNSSPRFDSLKSIIH